jgi:hypothetical protein
MQGTLKKGSRFLITSRDYIWNAAKAELKLQAFPMLRKSQVIINVHELTLEEKARILYNHIKLGDQPSSFRQKLKPFLPSVAQSADFLPETARRLGTSLFTERLLPIEDDVLKFFEEPAEFLEQTIEGLSSESRAAIALIFLNGGVVRSPVSSDRMITPGSAFGVTPAQIRGELQALNGSILKLAEDEDGPYWTYQHPTVGDAFAAHVAKNSELVDLYLRGARPETILSEVVCAGIAVRGASVIVPVQLNDLLVERVASLRAGSLVSFICYRANASVTKKLLEQRPDLKERLKWFSSPLRDDIDVKFALTLKRHGLLTEKNRRIFVDAVRHSAVEEADDSFIEDREIAEILTAQEQDDILSDARDAWVNEANIESYVSKLGREWDNQYSPEDHFDNFKKAASNFAKALIGQVDEQQIKRAVEESIRTEVRSMMVRYDEEPRTSAPLQQSKPPSGSLEELFRDVEN